MTLVVVVLAGGTSRRFGTDKLAASVGGATLLDLTLAALPADAAVVVVGPERPTVRPVRFVRETPPGGGPAAALVTGLRVALDGGAGEIVVVPGDAPASGRGAALLLEALRGTPSAELSEASAARATAGSDRSGVAAVVAVDGEGREQPLQLAVGPAAARQLVELAGPTGGAGASARALVRALQPPAVRVPLPATETWDVDTREQLAVWEVARGQHTAAVLTAVPDLRRRRGTTAGPVVVALDGPSGAGKSTLAAALRLVTGATVLDGDDFYGPSLLGLAPAEREAMIDAEVVEVVIDWPRLRTEALAPLQAGRAATYRPFDWAAYDGRLAPEPRTLPAADLVVVDGVYSARPELADLVHLTVHLAVDPATQDARLAAREQDPPDWVRFWRRGEEHYFVHVRPPASFDLQLGRPEAAAPRTRR